MSAITVEAAEWFFAREATSVGLGQALNGREHEFPLTARALVGAVPAINVKIEWLHNGSLSENWTQILREPFLAATGTELASGNAAYLVEKRKTRALTRILETLETTLRDGIPGREDSDRPKSFCGGVRHYLGRDPQDGDKITLRILRDLHYLTNRQAPDMDAREDEWLLEFSLQVSPA